MILAVLLLIGVSSTLFAPAPEPGLVQRASATVAETSQTQDQTNPSTQANTPPAQQTTPQASAKPHSGGKRSRKKKSASSGCDPSSASSTDPNSNVRSAADASGATGSAKNSTASATPKQCPPAKIIVRQGGTTEPSIQLAGAPTADEAARKKNTINQMLDVTDQNLKKAAGLQLTSTQQDTVTQAKQFLEQSRAAITDGDLERARTLAWKAQVLSEDLVNPEK